MSELEIVSVYWNIFICVTSALFTVYGIDRLFCVIGKNIKRKRMLAEADKTHRFCCTTKALYVFNDEDCAELIGGQELELSGQYSYFFENGCNLPEGEYWVKEKVRVVKRN